MMTEEAYRIKPLEWETLPITGHRKFQAKTMFGTYLLSWSEYCVAVTIENSRGGTCYVETVRDFDKNATTEEMKNAAWADYLKRLLPALITINNQTEEG